MIEVEHRCWATSQCPAYFLVPAEQVALLHLVLQPLLQLGDLSFLLLHLAVQTSVRLGLRALESGLEGGSR